MTRNQSLLRKLKLLVLIRERYLRYEQILGLLPARSSSTLSRWLDELEEKKLISCDHKSGRRLTASLKLTEEGEAFVKDLILLPCGRKLILSQVEKADSRLRSIRSQRTHRADLAARILTWDKKSYR